MHACRLTRQTGNHLNVTSSCADDPTGRGRGNRVVVAGFSRSTGVPAAPGFQNVSALPQGLAASIAGTIARTACGGPVATGGPATPGQSGEGEADAVLHVAPPCRMRAAVLPALVLLRRFRRTDPADVRGHTGRRNCDRVSEHRARAGIGPRAEALVDAAWHHPRFARGRTVGATLSKRTSVDNSPAPAACWPGTIASCATERGVSRHHADARCGAG